MIKISNLSKKYGDHIVLHQINAYFSDGKIYGLVGKNGSGKTTLIECICGFCYPSTGSIEVDGNIIGVDCDFPQETGLLLDTPSFIPYYTGFKNLLNLSNVSQKISQEQVVAAMEEVDLLTRQ